MAYKTLYRVYRPQRFEDVAGQEHIITTLKHAVEENKIAHAYLFCGPRGTGKTTIADSHRSLGLGLALCRSIIEEHNGTLVLTDHAPHGCNFIFTLPLSEVTLNE